MPWELHGNCVHKKGNDAPIPGGCHDTRAEAETHLRALYASEPGAGKARRWGQRKDFDPNQPRNDQGEWSESGGGGGSRSLSPGKKRRLANLQRKRDELRQTLVDLRKRPGGQLTTASAERTLAGIEAEIDELEGKEKKARRKWGQRFTTPPAPLSVFKQADGRYRWVLISSNAFEDRDGEIVSQKALEADVARADTDGDYGPLDWWHTPVLLGDCDFNAMHGRMLVESGTFRDERVAERVKAAAPHLRVSIAFNHPATEPDAAGVFHTIRRYARSLLPAGQEANTLTAMPVVTKESETMLKDKLKALSTLLGGDDELVKHVLKQAESAEKSAEAAGVRTKAKKEDEDEKPAGEDAAADKPFPKDEAEDDETAEKKEADAPAVIGDMTPAEFTQFLGTALKGVTDRLTTLETATATKEAAQAAQAQALKALDGKLDKIAGAAEEALAGVKELKGELPRVLGDKRTGTFRPSQDAPEPSEKLKERMAANKEAQAGPHADDPWAKHMGAIFKATGQG